MNWLIQLKYILTRQFLHAAMLCALPFALSVLILQAQASRLFIPGNQNIILPATEIGEKKLFQEPDVVEPVNNEDAVSSDPPGATEQNNSTGDEILLRPPR